MSICRFATIAAALSMLAPAAAHATDDYIAASSRAPTPIKLCGEADGDRIKPALCREAGYDKLVARIDKAFDVALPKAPANVRPLLRRDQAWFNEMILDAADPLVEMDDPDLRAGFAETLQSRAAILESMVGAFGRTGLAGRWSSAFGSIVVTPAEGGAYRLAITINVNYGSKRHAECTAGALVQPAGAWLAGSLRPDEAAAAKAAAGDKVADGKSEPDKSEPDKSEPDKSEPTKSETKKPPTIKLRRQGETLRVVIAGGARGDDDLPGCESAEQITASYFPAGKPEAVSDRADTAFVTPTFNCARPETATEEEICADPELADNDQRLNRAWKALLPRLDDVTRRALTEDQRHWVKAVSAVPASGVGETDLADALHDRRSRPSQRIAARTDRLARWF
jgi:uncharacterized protein YecT (DUF1311 family)